jgi:hypothetical protein
MMERTLSLKQVAMEDLGKELVKKDKARTGRN